MWQFVSHSGAIKHYLEGERVGCTLILTPQDMVQELLDEMMESGDNEQVDMFNNDACHQMNNELSLEMDNNF